MKGKIKITSEMLAKENENKGALLINYIFLVLGIAVVFLPLLNVHTIAKTLMNMGIFFVLGFVPFGYFCGLRGILKVKGFYNDLKNGNYEVIEDTVTDKTRLSKSASESVENTDCTFETAIYSKKYNKSIPASYDEYKAINVGDTVYVVVLKNKKHSVGGFYPASKYEL